MRKALVTPFVVAGLTGLLTHGNGSAQVTEPSAVKTPGIQATIVEPIRVPLKTEFPGSSLTLTHPVNTLQPIPPSASKLPSPLN
jgi:hypothetical protein